MASNNPPAFPHVDQALQRQEAGMTLRDWFAGQALAGMGKHLIDDSDYVARHAYTVADAMLTERAKAGAA